MVYTFRAGPDSSVSFALSEVIESACVLKQPLSTDDILVLVTRDTDRGRAISVAPVQSQTAGEESDMRIAYQTQGRSGQVQKPVPVAARRVDDTTIIMGYSQ